MSWAYLHEGHELAYTRVLKMLEAGDSRASMLRDVRQCVQMHTKLRDEAQKAEFARYGGQMPLQKYAEMWADDAAAK